MCVKQKCLFQVKEKCFPVGFFDELKHLLFLAWPIIVMNLSRLMSPAVSMIMCGHLDKLQFDGAALANTLINVFGVTIDLGFSTACDTLFAQTYGSRNRRKLGLMLQRALLVMTIIYLLLACVHMNVDPILILLRQDAEVAKITSLYITLYLPGLYFDFLFLAISRYLQNQNIVIPIMISAFGGSIFNAIGQYVAIYVIGYGFEASAILQAVSCFLMFFIQLLYILISKVYKETWQGFEFFEALDCWGIFFKLGIPGIIMVSIEMWTFEIGIILAGTINEIQLGALSLSIQISAFAYIIHVGLAIAVSIRCGQFLGANRPKDAKLSAMAVIFTDLCDSLITAIIIFSLRTYLPYIFTSDSEIRQFASKLLFFIIIIQLLNGGISSACGIFRACGLQLRGAIVMVCSYYGVGIPIAFVLVFAVKMDIVGFLCGLVTGVFVECTVYLILIYKLNWNREAKKAQRIAEESKLEQENFGEERNNGYFENMEHDEKECLLGKRRMGASTEKDVAVRFCHSRTISGATDILPILVKKSVETTLPLKSRKMVLIKRTIFVSVVLAIFVGSILLRLNLKRSMYVPCISVANGTVVQQYKHYPLCNDTMFHS